jgi:hypothetical protein
MLKQIKNKGHLSWKSILLFVLIFALVGGYILLRSFASSPPSNIAYGDLNGDGIVNSADLNILIGSWGIASASADINGNGIVDIGDLSILLSHYGSSVTGVDGTIGCVGPGCSGKLPAPDTTQGTQYYISNSGVASNSGKDPNHPWPFSKADANTYQPGDVINFACGENFGHLSIGASGATGNPVIYQTYGSCGQATFAGIALTQKNWVTLYNVKANITTGSNTSAIVIDAPSSHVTIQGSDISTIRSANLGGISAGNPNNHNITFLTVDSSTIHDTGETGIFLYGDHNIVQYNKFFNNGGSCAGGCGTHSIYMKAEFSTFRFNDFGSVRDGSSISIRRTHDEEIYGNWFHNSPHPVSYYSEDAGGGTVDIYNNRFQDVNQWLYWVSTNRDSGFTGNPNVNTVWANNTVQGNSDGSSVLMAEDSAAGDQNVGTLKVYNMIVLGSGWPGFINNGGGGPVTQSHNLFMTATGVGIAPEFLLSTGSNALNLYQ